MEFGEVMKEIRLKNKWTLEDMAKKLNTTKQALSKYERGERTPKITVAAKFAEILDVPLELLIGYEYHDEDPFPYQEPLTVEARILAKGIDKLPPEQREQALNVIRAMFVKYADYFEKETSHSYYISTSTAAHVGNR